MNISLTPQLENLVKQKVKAGLYNSISEVIREALRLLEEKDQLRAVKLEALRRDIQEGLDSGESIPLDIESVITRGHEKLAKQKQKNE